MIITWVQTVENKWWVQKILKGYTKFGSWIDEIHWEVCVYEKKEYEIIRQRIVIFTKLDDTERIWWKLMIF